MTKSWTILTGDNRLTLRTIADNSIDSIVTDPPYGIDFLGKAWDANTGALETYQECLRVLKPGGHILAFSAARTYHHLAVTLEQAGFEIRDQIMWIYSSGFPKSQDVGRGIQRSLGVKKTKKVKDDGSKAKHYDYGMKASDENEMVVVTDPQAQQWSGWGTALKPAHEPICLARKPLKQSIAKNCQEWGVGALNIDACRIASTDLKPGTMGKSPPNLNAIGTPSQIETSDQPWIPSDAGRFPSNVIGDIPLYQKYFYCPKVSRAERHIGHQDPGPQTARARDDDGSVLPYAEKVDGASPTMLAERLANSPGNNHPTVKPVALMRYLIQLITPAGGTVLDPFTGSGSTGMAAVELGHTFVGCELDANYVDIANKRIQAWLDLQRDPNFDRLFEIAE